MKIGIISDTHGDMRSIEKAIPYLEKCDLIIHAGDYIDDAEYIHYATDVEVKCVKGNSDLYRFDGDYELTFSVKNKKLREQFVKITEDNFDDEINFLCADKLAEIKQKIPPKRGTSPCI